MSVRNPTISVVVPVLERPEFLRRALSSVAVQTLADFECVVVDDGSTDRLEPVVEAFGSRFVYLRREDNGGSVAARLTGYGRVTGSMVMNLDSDDELMPRALARSVHLLERHSDVDAVVGLTQIDGKLPLRVRGGPRTVEPAAYARRSPPPFDVVGAFRRSVFEEWLAELPPFFKEEFALWLTLGLRHRLLYVDEQWGIHHSDAPDRLSRNFGDPRWLDDLRTFVGHFRPQLGTVPCAPLDHYLTHRRYLLTRRGHREEAALVSSWLSERGVGLLRQMRILLRTRYRDRRGYVV